jgi:hypothetical protein
LRNTNSNKTRGETRCSGRVAVPAFQYWFLSSYYCQTSGAKSRMRTGRGCDYVHSLCTTSGPSIRKVVSHSVLSIHQCIISIYWTLGINHKCCVFLISNFNYISVVKVRCIGTTVPEKQAIYSPSLTNFSTYNFSNIFRAGGIRVEMSTDCVVY